MATERSSPGASDPVAVFAPNPLLGITIEARGTAGDYIHLRPGGQGVSLTRMAGELGASPVLCGFIGGEAGKALRPLLDQLPGARRLVETAGATGCYVFDRRSGERRLVSQALSPSPSRHELDALFATACTAAVDSRVLAVCNPDPDDSLPLELYGNLVADVRANGVPVIVDLSSPRLESALDGAPDLVKVNDRELAELVSGPVSHPVQLRDAARWIGDRGAGLVVVTQGGDPALVLRGGEAWELVPPRFDRGSPEGCGDSMMGGIAAALASGRDWDQALVLGAAAGTVNFLRHGRGTGSGPTIEEIAAKVRLTPL